MLGEGRLGRYRLLRPLGRGGMGEVYLASFEGAAGFEKRVAVKVLDERLVGDPERTRALLREAFLGVQLDHPNVVEILDLGDDDGRYFVVMEYVRGYSLAQLIDFLHGRGERVPLRCAAHLVRALADALRYVHGVRDVSGKPLSLVHGDVSPSNVLVGRDGQIKLSDFGVATLATDGAVREQLAGKLCYLPPESYTGALRDQSWDVYAMGAVLYEMLAGRPAFPGRTPRDVQRSMRQGLPALADVQPDCPPALAELAERALSPDAARRFTTAPALRAALDAALPRQGDDPDAYQSWLAELTELPVFVEACGSLPQGVSYSPERELEPFLDETAMPKTVTPASARGRSTALRFGLSPAIGARRARESAAWVARMISRQLEREVRPVVLADYEELVQCVVEGEVDFAWMPPRAFAAAAESGAGPIVTLERNGRTSFEAAIIVRDDSPRTSIAELRGATMAWVDRQSSGGYFLPRSEIAARVGDPDALLGRQDFHGSHAAVCQAVVRGWADAGGTYVTLAPDGTVLRSAWQELLDEQEAARIRPIAFTRPIPADSIAYRPFLPDKLVATLTDAFMSLTHTNAGRVMLRQVFNATGFERPDAALFDDVRAALRSG